MSKQVRNQLREMYRFALWLANTETSAMDRNRAEFDRLLEQLPGKTDSAETAVSSLQAVAAELRRSASALANGGGVGHEVAKLGELAQRLDAQGGITTAQPRMVIRGGGESDVCTLCGPYPRNHSFETHCRQVHEGHRPQAGEDAVLYSSSYVEGVRSELLRCKTALRPFGHLLPDVLRARDILKL